MAAKAPGLPKNKAKSNKAFSEIRRELADAEVLSKP
jgi:hypothetical protein